MSSSLDLEDLKVLEARILSVLRTVNALSTYTSKVRKIWTTVSCSPLYVSQTARPHNGRDTQPLV